MFHGPASTRVTSQQANQVVDSGHDAIGAGDRRRVRGQRIADAIAHSCHPAQHFGERVLLAAETDEHCPVIGDAALRRITPVYLHLVAVALDHRA